MGKKKNRKNKKKFDLRFFEINDRVTIDPLSADGLFWFDHTFKTQANSVQLTKENSDIYLKMAKKEKLKIIYGVSREEKA